MLFNSCKIVSPLCEMCGQRGGDVPLYHTNGTVDLYHNECAKAKMEKRKVR